MDLLAPLDLYCERSNPGLWAEPLNALSNVAFLIAAALLWRQAHPGGSGQGQRSFATLVALIGFCSGLFHFFGTVWGVILDVGSITLFILAFIHQYLRRLARWHPWQAALGVVGFICADRLLDAIGSFGLNGSETYLLPGALLICFALWSRHLVPTATPWLTRAACIFPLSLALRTLDNALCTSWPIGTHFAWHLLNACVLYVCVRGLFAPDGRS